ncbi:MAG: succinate dehydrogenase assembly factor 2 [Mariprofundaceae bacterium]
MDIRRLRYRMRRQGMLELDEWLTPLEKALEFSLQEGDGEIISQIEAMVAADTPELLAMMHGETPLPEGVRPWLEHS